MHLLFFYSYPNTNICEKCRERLRFRRISKCIYEREITFFFYLSSLEPIKITESLPSVPRTSGERILYSILRERYYVHSVNLNIIHSRDFLFWYLWYARVVGFFFSRELLEKVIGTTNVCGKIVMLICQWDPHLYIYAILRIRSYCYFFSHRRGILILDRGKFSKPRQRKISRKWDWVNWKVRSKKKKTKKNSASKRQKYTSIRASRSWSKKVTTRSRDAKMKKIEEGKKNRRRVRERELQSGRSDPAEREPGYTLDICSPSALRKMSRIPESHLLLPSLFLSFWLSFLAYCSNFSYRSSFLENSNSQDQSFIRRVLHRDEKKKINKNNLKIPRGSTTRRTFASI